MENNNKLYVANGVYYSDGYLSYKYYNCSPRLRSLNKTMWGYKQGLNQYFDEIVEDAIRKIVVDNSTPYKVALVTVPSSKMNKEGAVAGTVKRIIGSLNNSILTDYIDATDLLKRNRDLESQCKSGIRHSVSTLKEATDINGYVDQSATYIILDDVTTVGSSLQAAREMLIEAGVPAKKVLTYAILKTRYTEKDYVGKVVGEKCAY